MCREMNLLDETMVSQTVQLSLYLLNSTPANALEACLAALDVLPLAAETKT
jgi:hypothetical protein